jgi:Putative MetA-pathway of phenol degradation
MLKRFFILFFNLALVSGPLYACSVCGCGDPLASSASAQPSEGSWRLDIQNIYLTASAESDDLTGSTETVRQVNLNTTLTYDASDDLALSVLFPLVEKYWYYVASPTALAQGIGNDEGTPFGIGDMMLGFRYFFWKETDFQTKQHQALAVSGGIYLPTGGTNFTSLITGNNLDTHAQLGTGAFAFYLGLLYNHIWDGFSLNVSGTAVHRTTAYTNDPNSPVYDYSFGSSFTGGITGQLKIDDPLAVSFAVEGRYAYADTELNPLVGPGIVDTPGTGGTVIDLTPGISWNVTGTSSLYAKVQIPVYTAFIGTQEVDPTYMVGTSFFLK